MAAKKEEGVSMRMRIRNENEADWKFRTETDGLRDGLISFDAFSHSYEFID